MPRGKKYGPEEIIPKLREAEVLISQGTTQELSAKHVPRTPFPAIFGAVGQEGSSSSSHSSLVCSLQSPAREPSVKPHWPAANVVALWFASDQSRASRQSALLK